MPRTRKKLNKAALTANVPAHVAPIELSEAERRAVSQFVDRNEASPPMAAAKVEVDGATVRLSWHHENQAVGAALWANALGTGDMNFAAAVFEQVVQVSRTGPAICETELNRMLALVRGLAPTDPTEALLAAQMAAVHNATMVAARRLGHIETLAQQDSASTMLNKLCRTFAAQVEALKRYRTGGEQTIKVQYVTVSGGQAIVGDVQHTGGLLRTESQCHEQLTAANALSPALFGPVEEDRQPMPSPGREGKARVPVPRGTRRSAERKGQRRLSARASHQ